MQRRKIGYGVLWLWALLLSYIGHGQSPNTLKFEHYTSQDGLPSSYVKGMVQDHLGFVWLANRENICRFDGYNFQSFPAYTEDSEALNLRPDFVYNVADTLLLVRNVDTQFYGFDYRSENFRAFDPLNQIEGVGQLIESDSGVWFLKDSTLWFSDLVTPARSNLRLGQTELNWSSVSDFSLQDNQLVLVDWSGSNGAVHFVDSQGHRSFRLPFPTVELLYLDSHGGIWICDHTQGLCRINTETNKYEYYSSSKKGRFRLSHNYAYVINEDQDGTLWIGTEGGVSLWSTRDRIFSINQFDLSNPQGLSSNPIYSMLCDQQGNMWLGTYFSGINLWKNRETFFKTITAGSGDYYLGGSAVSAFTEDHQGNLWVGLEDMGLNKINRRTGKITKFPMGREQGGLSSGNIHDLHFIDENHLWIATYTGGINVLNVQSGKLEFIHTENTPGLKSNDIYSLCVAGDSIFICTTNGISIFNKKNRSIQPFYPDLFENVLIESSSFTGHKVWFSSRTDIYSYDLKSAKLNQLENPFKINGINFVKGDSKGRLWAGDSYKGLFCYIPSSGEWKHYSEEKGFQGSWVYSIQEGANDWFWVCTNKGVVKLDPVTGKSFLFDRDSGMPFNQFNYRSAYKDRNGIVYLGSNEGLLYFDENRQPLVEHSTNVVLTSLKLFNQPVAPNDENEVLSNALAETKAIELAYQQNVFTVEFSALNYQNKGKCNYAYYLEGFESDYNFVGNQSFATYTNLSPGTYTFKVKASLDNSSWSGNVTELKVTVLPPFWSSVWGYLLYAVLILGILVLIAMVSSRIQKSKSQAHIERNERIHAIQLNQMKLEFFTNISHELRTPLTLIVGPLTALIANEKVSPFVKDKLNSINLNAQRLLQLLNQLLEFRKIEQGKEGLRISETEIGLLFENLEQSFGSAAEQSGLTLDFNHVQAEGKIYMDASKVEKILINLISNAFKFTEAGGSIEVSAKLGSDEMGERTLRLTVRDTGKGMESSVIDKIFDRFYQSEEKSDHTKSGVGSGIGLSFVNSLVSLHKGKIRVKSRLNIGTIFKVEIPVSKESYSVEELVEAEFVSTLGASPVLPIRSQKPIDPVPADAKTGSPTIMLVEDNQELLDFISGSLSENYKIVTASNGQEGLDQLKENQVDLILSDVMMPVMDGFEFTHRVKHDIETSHIPVILLTAKSGPENKYEGLRTGADIYVEKPFLAHILEQNIRNVLHTRRHLIKKYKRDAYMPATELTHSESDKKFLDNLTSIIKENMAKPELDVSFLINEAGVSRTMLHLKLKKLADCSATEFINIIRLKEAVTLMSEEECNVSEAAYRTGFSSPTYFTRRFKQHYGQSPRDFIQQESNRV